MYPVILLSLKLLPIQLPLIAVPFERRNEFFSMDNYLFGSQFMEDKYGFYPDTFLFQTRSFFTEDPLYYVNPFSDTTLSGLYGTSHPEKKLGGYIKRRVGNFYLNGNIRNFNDSLFYRVMLDYSLKNIKLGGTYSNEKNFSIFLTTPFAGFTYGGSGKLFWLHIFDFIGGMYDTTFFIYGAVPLKSPIFYLHLYLNSEQKFYVSPLYLLNDRSSIYLVISHIPSIGLSTDRGGVEIGYNLNTGFFNFYGHIDTRFAKISLKSESNKEWWLEGYLLSYFKDDNVNIGLCFRRKYELKGIYLYSRFYGLKIYSGVETDSTLTIKPHFSIYLDVVD